MNRESSRSHAVFSVIVEKSETDQDGESNVTIGRLNLVDLAGSERISKTGIEGGRQLDEMKNINTSLTAFGKVVMALTSPGNHFVPYRDSKLTRILQGSLGGNCKTTMITTVTSAENSYRETLNSLKFAKRAKNVKNFAVVNQDLSERALLSMYEKEIKKLRAALTAQKEGGDTSDVENLLHQKKLLASEKIQMQGLLEQQTEEAERAMEEKMLLTEKINSLEEQLLLGGHKIEESVEFIHAVQQVEARLEQEYTHKFREIEEEKQKLAKEKMKLEREKTELQRQRTELLRQTSNLSRMSEIANAIQITEEWEEDDNEENGVSKSKTTPLSPHPPSDKPSKLRRRKSSNTRDSSPPRMHVKRHGSNHRVVYTPPTRQVKTGLFDDLMDGEAAIEGDELNSSDEEDNIEVNPSIDNGDMEEEEDDETEGEIEAEEAIESKVKNYVGTRAQEDVDLSSATHAMSLLHHHAMLEGDESGSISHRSSTSSSSSLRGQGRSTSPNPLSSSARGRNLPFMPTSASRKRSPSSSKLAEEHARSNQGSSRPSQDDGNHHSRSTKGSLMNTLRRQTPKVSDRLSRRKQQPSPRSAPMTREPSKVSASSRENTSVSLHNTPTQRTEMDATVDDYVLALRNSISGVPLQNIEIGGKIERNVFSGRSLVDWFMENVESIALVEDAIDLGQTFIDVGVISGLKGETKVIPTDTVLYKFQTFNSAKQRGTINKIVPPQQQSQLQQQPLQQQPAVNDGLLSPKPKKTRNKSFSRFFSSTFLRTQKHAHEDRPSETKHTEQKVDNETDELSKTMMRELGILSDGEQGSSEDVDLGASLLHHAAGRGDRAAIKEFVKTMDINLVDNLGRPPLMYACIGNKAKAAEYLLSIGADERMMDHNGHTALVWAAYFDHHDIIRILLKHDPGALELLDPTHRSALHWSVKHDSTQSMDEILKVCSVETVNLQDEEQVTALHWAVLCQHDLHALHLLQAGADLSLADKHGRTALHYAVSNDSPACLTMLLTSDLASDVVNIKDTRGRTVLHLAIGEQRPLEMVMAILTHSQVDVNAIDVGTRTPLHWAAVCNREDVCELLVRKGAKLQYRDKTGMTPLHWAMEKGFKECAATLQRLASQSSNIKNIRSSRRNMPGRVTPAQAFFSKAA